MPSMWANRSDAYSLRTRATQIRSEDTCPYDHRSDSQADAIGSPDSCRPLTLTAFAIPHIRMRISRGIVGYGMG